ncbi:MAG: hypothetical protein GX135_06080 [Candidatus Cloacimonetes bacterium]|nr:hypothetical protein [Candidatus Cloacimonadota bacterium]
MKKLLVLIAVLALGLALFADDAKSEAVQAIDTAKTFINKGNYGKAREELEYAMAKIDEILGEDLLNYLPAGSGGFKLNEKSFTPLNILGSGMTAMGEYEKGDADFTLTISVGGILGQSGGLMGLANLFGISGAAGKSTRVSGYTANLEFDESDRSGTLIVKVNDRITVTVNGSNISSSDLLKALAEQVDFSALEKDY